MDDFGATFTMLGELRTRPLFVMTVGVPRIHAIVGSDGLDRCVGPMAERQFQSERISGRILSGGADWQTVRADGAVLLDARVVLSTDEGKAVAMNYSGIRTGSGSVPAQLARGEAVDSDDYLSRGKIIAIASQLNFMADGAHVALPSFIRGARADLEIISPGIECTKAPALSVSRFHIATGCRFIDNKRNLSKEGQKLS